MSGSEDREGIKGIPPVFDVAERTQAYDLVGVGRGREG